MTQNAFIPKPLQRTRFRRALGKRYYIWKRRIAQLRSPNKWARKDSEQLLSFTVIGQRSLILRPLKNVDMYLQENKRTNLRLAIEHLDGIVLRPGETFSFWKCVGKPTARKGYLEGLVLRQGQITHGTGGGLCQLGNLLFWMFIHSPLTITERHRHGFDVFPDVNRKVPFGAGATLSYNYIDLQVRNDTDRSFGLKLWLDATHLNGNLLCESPLETSFSIEERDHIIRHQSWGGYSRHNRIVRITTDGDEQFEELIAENHAIMMYNPLLEYK